MHFQICKFGQIWMKKIGRFNTFPSFIWELLACFQMGNVLARMMWVTYHEGCFLFNHLFTKLTYTSHEPYIHFPSLRPRLSRRKIW